MAKHNVFEKNIFLSMPIKVITIKVFLICKIVESMYFWINLLQAAQTVLFTGGNLPTVIIDWFN